MLINQKFNNLMQMAWKLIVTTLSLLVISCVSQKSTTTEVLVDAKFEKYHIFHAASLMNVDISKELIVNGKVTIANSKLNKVFINGLADIQNSVINEMINFTGKMRLNKVLVKKDIIGHGLLEATNANLQDIQLETKKIILINTKVHSIRVKKFKNASIYLRQGSVVMGNITFDLGQGRVVIDKESKVNGKIDSDVNKEEFVEVKIGKKY